MISLAKKIYHFTKRREDKNKQKYLQSRFKNSYVSSTVIFDSNTVVGNNCAILGDSNISSSYFGDYTYLCGAKVSKTSIGKYCSIASQVHIVSLQHLTNFVSTYPLFYKKGDVFPYGEDIEIFNNAIKCSNGYEVIIKDDVWIGESVIIKGGVIIGEGAVIGMGSVVTKDVPHMLSLVVYLLKLLDIVLIKTQLMNY